MKLRSMDLKTVVIINSYASINGGATRVATDEARGLAERGIRVKFISAVGPVSEELRHENIEVSCLHQSALLNSTTPLRTALNATWNAAAYGQMRHALSDCDPFNTAVHVHGFSHGISVSPIKCAIDLGYSPIHTVHDYFSVCPTGSFFDFKSHESCELTPLSVSCVSRNCDRRSYAHKLYRVARMQFQRGLKIFQTGIRHFICLSPKALQLAKDHLPLNSEFFLLQNPCAVPRCDPVEIYDRSKFVFIGRLDELKGVHFLLKALTGLKSEVLFVGDGPLRTDVESSPNCSVSGWGSRESVIRDLASSRCLIFPSLCRETFGLSVIDAAAIGVPSIVTSISGASDYVVNDDTGWIINPHDVGALQQRLALASNTEIARAFGLRAHRRYWDSPMTPEIHTTKLIDIYLKLLDEQTR